MPHEGLRNVSPVVVMVSDNSVQVSMGIILIVQLDCCGLDEGIVETEDAIMFG